MTTPLASGLLAFDPRIDRLIPFDKRKGEKGLPGLVKKARQLKAMGFDKVFSLHRSPRTALLLFLAGIPVRVGFRDAAFGLFYTRTVRRVMTGHAVTRNLCILSGERDPAGADPPMRLFPPPADRVSPAVLEALPRQGGYAVLAPGSAWKTKQWHPGGFAGAARDLAGMGIRSVLIGAEEERAVCGRIAREAPGAIDLSGRLTLPDTLHVMAGCRLVLCNDSMALHMASALERPTVAVFCATSPEFGFGPWKNPRARVVEAGGLDCKPCRRHGGERCPNGTEACMRLPHGPVVEACLEVLDRKDPEETP
jgi:heptosyltransferase-2